MKNKKTKIKKYFSSNRLDILLILFLFIIIAVLKPVLAVPVLLVITVIIYMDAVNEEKEKKTVSSMIEETVACMDEITSATVVQNPFPLCLINSDGKILWRNDKYKCIFNNDDGDDEDNDIYDLTGVKINKLTNEELKDRSIQISALNRSFRIQYSETTIGKTEEEKKELRLLYWMETTANENLKKTYRDERLCIAHIIVDNLEDILAQAPDDKKTTIAGDVERIIRQWSTKLQAALIRSSKTKYTMLCDARNLENITANKFQILDDIRAIVTGADIPVSLSVGVGASGKSIAQTEEYAKAALDLAQSRGGDQAVVRKGSNFEYFGGKLQTVEKRNKGKSKIVALALRGLIDQSPRVFVMGHKLPDMDSLGAALGIVSMAAAKGKPANIVIDSWDAVDMLYKLANDENPELFIKSEQAKQIAGKDDLLVVVDTSKPSMAECGELGDLVDKVVIIDHHRRGQEIFAKQTLVHIEPYASSTSELVTEMLQYTSADKKGLTSVQAEGLLSGIAVDTKNFSIKTGVRTFEAAAWLRRQGADTTVVRQFFQTDMNLLQKKAQILSGARRIRSDIAIAGCQGPQPNISVLISMAADELLNIRGMRASFVVGENDDGSLRVSARSLGEINVQIIMERLGGGGNLTTAGARLTDITVNDALHIVEKTVNEYLCEEAEKLKKQQEKQQAKLSRDTERLSLSEIEKESRKEH